MNEFKTHKSFRNVFGDHVGELKERLDLFVNHPEWYQDRGIPHSLGILLHGIPGAGKTSTIKAIAKDTGRHIFNLSLRTYTTQKQLLHLFFNETIHVGGPGQQTQTYNIPLNQRIYVIEDIDCLTDIVYDRQRQTGGAATGAAATAQGGDAVNLGFLLNLLDGVLETPGRILVITTNYPERLDKALVRPGRIDVKIRFSWASRELIREMVENFYERHVGLAEIPEDLEDALSPAEVLESLCTYFKDAAGALGHMQKRVKERMERMEGQMQHMLDLTPLEGIRDPMKQSLMVSTPSRGTLLETLEAQEDQEAHEIAQEAQERTQEGHKEAHKEARAAHQKGQETPNGVQEVQQLPTPFIQNTKKIKENIRTTANQLNVNPNLLEHGGMFQSLPHTEYNLGFDITFIPPEKAEEYVREYMARQDFTRSTL